MEQKEIKILSTEPIKNESEFAELVPSEILKEIQEKIQTMMSRLCINTEITLTVKYNEYSQRVVVTLQSTEFNTVPVIFKSIHLEGRSQPVVETIDNGNEIFYRIKFCFFISYRYEDFGHGTNGTDLGSVEFICLKEQNYTKLFTSGLKIMSVY